MTLQIKQSAHYEGKDQWHWSVWLEGTKPELNAIDHVVYTLHSTFPDPVRPVKTRNNGFRLDSGGWGEFRIFLQIVRRDGKSTQRSHYLKLAYPEVPLPTERRRGRSAAPRRAQPKDPAPHTIYLSSGAADAALARKLRERLTQHGVKVSSAEDIEPGMPLSRGIHKAIEGADATVFVVSGEPNLWSQLEMNYANAQKPGTVVPVLVGERTPLPAPLADLNTVRIESDSDVGTVTDQILRATTALPK